MYIRVIYFYTLKTIVVKITLKKNLPASWVPTYNLGIIISLGYNFKSEKLGSFLYHRYIEYVVS